MSLATASVLAQQNQQEVQEENKFVVPGTFGGEGVLGHEQRITTSNNASDYSGNYNGVMSGDGGMLSFQPGGLADKAPSNNEPMFTMPDEDSNLNNKSSFKRAGGEPIPESFGGNALLP